ncbi:MAG: enoyl-CoA hydratase/isomerase family protein [Deltaproteobacteria bacterium]
MSLIRSERQADVLVLHLARGRANALNAELLGQLHGAVELAATDAGVRALVLASDAPNLFCAGFDVSEVFAYDRVRMLEFFSRFVRTFERLRTLPKPLLCALAGHAFAGGAILALAADFRVMAERALIAVNEVDLAVSLPVTMIRALAGGLVSEVLPAADVLAATVRRAQRLATKPAQAFLVHKRALDPIAGGVVSEAEIEHTVEAWFSEEASARRRALTQRMAEKLADASSARRP